MAAYIVAEVEVSDPERFRAYQALARTVVESFGGWFVASSQAVEPLEGGWHPQRVVIVGFDSLARCREFFYSAGYQAAIRARQGAARLNIIAVEGLAGRPAHTPAEESAMPAYLIAEIEVTDAERYETYKKLAPPAIAKFGGRYIARGGETAVLEGDWHPKRLVIVEFPSLARAREFYASPEYRKAIAARTGAADARLVAVEGL